MTGSFAWTDEAVEILRDRWGKDTATAIAILLDAPTRNVVIGKAHRLGLSNKRQPKRADLYMKPLPRSVIQKKRSGQPQGAASALTGYETLRKKTKPSGATMEAIASPGEPLAESLMVELWQVKDGQCRFPYGEPSDIDSFRFCGAPKHAESPYCIVHDQLCHTAASPRMIGSPGSPRPKGATRNVTQAAFLASSCDREEAA